MVFRILKEAKFSLLFSPLLLVRIGCDLTPKAQATKAKVNKWVHIKFKSFCTDKKKTSKM